MRKVQQLRYRQGRFFCPVHGSANLVSMSLGAEPDMYGYMCLSRLDHSEDSMPCGNSAEWRTRESMMHDLLECENASPSLR
jgi:hypothetical protein